VSRRRQVIGVDFTVGAGCGVSIGHAVQVDIRPATNPDLAE
jgi:hypothetical protein